MFAGKSEHVAERVFREEGVGVEEEDIFAAGLAERQVIGLTETHVAAVGDEVEVGETLSGKLF